MPCCNNYLDGVVQITDYQSDVQPNWCGGCGNYAIWTALKRALVELEIPPHEVMLCFDVGCNGNMSDKIRGYRIHSLHGRVLPLAAGIKIANPKLKVIAMAGDGATYSEGINHFINSIRNNYPITFLVHNNGNYGLTTGQASATTPQGAPRTANPYGPTAQTLNPLSLALSLSPSYVAQGTSGDIKLLTEQIKSAIGYQDNGFAYMDILQACPTYNKQSTQNDLLNTISLSDTGHDSSSISAAYKLVNEPSEKIYTGLIYKNPKLPTYFSYLKHRLNDKWDKTTPIEEVNQPPAEIISKLISRHS